MSGIQPRRPAQLKPEQMELIQGEADTAFSSELAHTCAQVIIPLPTAHALDTETIARVKALIQTEGVDLLAEAWVTSPEDSLPGILWRGYLLREWIRRFPDEAIGRYTASRKYFAVQEPEKLDLVREPQDLQAVWDEVFAGDYRGDFAQVLRDSARFCDFLGSVIPGWVADETHPLATAVTLRETALLRVASEFLHAGELLRGGKLS
ncbi:hypothetical protein RQN30_09110 [Arcanobacterium hippocoleae]